MTGDRLHVITTDTRRGAEVRSADLVAALRAGGSPDRLVALRASGAPATVDVESLGDRATRHPSTLLALRRRSRQARVLVGHGGDTLSACAVAGWGVGVPFVYETIGDPAYWRRRAGRSRLAELCLHRASAVVVLFPAARDAVHREDVRRERIHVIPSGVTADRFACADHAATADARRRLRLDEERPVVAVVGALSPEKDPLAAVAACPVDAQLVFAGGGPLLEELRGIAARDSARIRVLGPTSDVRTVYAAADVVLLPSRTEGLPGVAIEAAMSGLPVVATDVGGTGAVVRDGETGILVPPGDSAALAAAVIEALRRPELGGEHARKWAIDHFDLSRAAAAWDDLLRTIERS